MPPGGEARPTSFKQLVRRLAKQARQGTTFPFAIEVEGRFAGQVTVNNIVRGSAHVRLGRLLARPGLRRPRRDAPRGGDGDRPLLLHRRPAPRSRSRSGRRTPTRCGWSRSSSIREIGYAPKFLHIDGAWRDHRLYAITKEEVPDGMLARLRASASRDRLPNPSSHTSLFATHGLTCAPGCAPTPSLSTVDPSALIFVALAVAWAVYLIPKALEHHEESARTRTVERFSATLRVLARREPVSRRKARLVTPDAASPSSDRERSPRRRRSCRPSAHPTAEPAHRAQLRARRQAAARAARRRLRVVTPDPGRERRRGRAGLLQDLRLGLVRGPGRRAGGLAGRLPADGPARARRAAARAGSRPRSPAEAPKDDTDEIARVDAPLLGDERPERDPDSWDPVSVPLPTYVSKPVATAQRQHHRPRLDRRLELGPQRLRQRAGPRGRRRRAGPPATPQQRRASGA